MTNLKVPRRKLVRYFTDSFHTSWIMAENNVKKNFSELSLTGFISTVLVAKLCKKIKNFFDKCLLFHSVNSMCFLRFNMMWKNGFLDNCPQRKLPSTPKLILSQTLTLNGGHVFSGAIVWLPSNPKTNPDLDPNPNPNQGEIVRIPKRGYFSICCEQSKKKKKLLFQRKKAASESYSSKYLYAKRSNHYKLFLKKRCSSFWLTWKS